MSYWVPTSHQPAFQPGEFAVVCERFREPVSVILDSGSRRIGAGLGGQIVSNGAAPSGGFDVSGTLPALYPEWLGDRSFLETHKVRFPYVAGEMAHGIASPQLVIAMARNRMLAFYGAGGVAPDKVEAAIRQIAAETAAESLSWGANLIHMPADPPLEDHISDLYIRLGVHRVCASAYMRLTPAVVRYAVTGLRTDSSGRIVRANHLFAKLSRPEVARQFLSPAPREIVSKLVAQGKLTAAEANLSQRVPLAADLTVESDSGGHTDNRPLAVLLPSIMAVRDQLVAQHGYPEAIRIGAAGGIGTPAGVAGAFALGAAYVLTGSINQSSLEAATSPTAKQMLLDADLADVIMAPSPDMFELGIRVQVLKRGTLFAGRARKLYELYSQHGGLDEIPAQEREKIEREVFRKTLDQVWAETERFFEQRNPVQLARAAGDPKHKMALVFRWYVGQSSHWAITGDAARKMDYQIWCGPAMGAFNAWVCGSFLGDLANRSVVQIALNLLEGSAVITRAHQLRSYGVPVPTQAFDYRPRQLPQVK